MKLRWLRIHGSDLGGTHPSARPDSDTRYFLVLQQWVENPKSSECAGIDYSEDGMWQDIPIIESKMGD